jgi:hypothetical protein
MPAGDSNVIRLKAVNLKIYTVEMVIETYGMLSYSMFAFQVTPRAIFQTHSLEFMHQP